MPTASTESAEKKGPVEAPTPIKQAIQIVEKKVRNLEKRKNKLEIVREKIASGHEVEADQRNAVEHYNEVVYTLEYSRELQKQFAAIQNECQKMAKTQARRDKVERRIHEIKRIQELLRVQNLLDNMGSENVRSDFQTGKHGAVVLTEENLNHLDELYQLISPTRDGDGEYHKKVTTAAEHIVNLLEGKQKEVIAGTTYKELKELIDLIDGCGYFETVENLETEKKQLSTPEDAVGDDEVHGSVDIDSSEDDKTESQHGDIPLEHTPMNQPLPDHRDQQMAPPSQLNNMAAQENVFYSGSLYTAPPQRPVDEIVSAVQGSFDFLQESTIDVECMPHNDPAVVAAQPMSRQATSDPDPRPLSGFGSQAYDGQNEPTQPQHSSNHGNSMTDQRFPQSDQSALAQSNLDYSTSQPFRQTNLSQNLPSESWASQVEDDSTIGQFDLPPSIPLPQAQDNPANIANQSEKKFTMNAAAPAFQSMYSQPMHDQMGDGPNRMSGNDGTSGNFQSNRYHNDGFQQRGPRRDGSGFRGRGGRGGNGNGGGNSGMQNGFGRNSGQNSGRGGRGGSYQGYTPRNNYQEGYNQGYNNGSGGFGQGYKQQRGGGGQGTMRGGSGNIRGNGGMRGGGSQRGGGGNAPRSGPPRTGGFGRPQTAQYQQ